MRPGLPWIALFRGVNLGGHGKLPMAELRALASRLGFDNPRTYIQSGNLVFGSDQADRGHLEIQIAQAVESQFGFRPIILLRTANEVQKGLDANPFADLVTEGKQLHLFFIDGPADRWNEDALRTLASPTEDFALIDDVVYVFAPDGIGKSVLVEKLPRYLPKRYTARNLNSVRAVLAMANG